MKKSSKVATGVLLVVVALGYWRHHQHTRHGFTLTRYAADSIRISWGTPSGAEISPESTMRFFWGFSLRHAAPVYFPPLSGLQDVWMYDLDPESLGSALPASYVNPLNDDAFEQMFRMISLCDGGDKNADEMTRIAARNYLYLGWVVMSNDDAIALKRTLSNRSQVDLYEDLETPLGVLPRLSTGVESRVAADPSDEVELERLRGTIPVMFEVLSPDAGHPCDAMHVVYLDGHIERIPVGEKFPATEDFIEAFRPPKSVR